MIKLKTVNNEKEIEDDADQTIIKKQPIRAALYTRVSTEDQAKKGFSLAAQKEKLRAYCRAKGWKVIKEYMDDGYSGRDENRPGYRKMLEDRDTWEILVILKMDRIHRNSVNFASMMDKLKTWEKGFASVQESFDSTTAMGRFVMDIIQRIAQLESEQISERVKLGMTQKAKSGKGYLGFNIPYGYDYFDGKLVLNGDEAKIVKMIFQSYLAGMSIRAIVKLLNNRGVMTKTGKRWAKQTVATILKNPVYCGIKHWQDILHDDAHNKIIDIQTFNKIQSLRVSRIRNSKQNKGAFEIVND